MNDQTEAATIEVSQAWVDEVCLALDAATIIGMRSCNSGDGLHYGNHDRLLQHAVSEGWTFFEMKSLPLTGTTNPTDPDQ